MKNLLLAALVVSLSSTASVSQAADTPPRREQTEQRLQHLAQELALTEVQKSQVAAVFRVEGEKIAALRANDSLRPRKKLKEFREIREGIRAQVRALLTPEQQAKFDALPKSQRRPGGAG
jgi:Spy/CpxP family protein refolding chaperone